MALEKRLGRSIKICHFTAASGNGVPDRFGPLYDHPATVAQYPPMQLPGIPDLGRDQAPPVLIGRPNFLRGVERRFRKNGGEVRTDSGLQGNLPTGTKMTLFLGVGLH